MKVHMSTPEEVLAMSLAGVQCVCCNKTSEWPDEVFEVKGMAGVGEDTMLEHYQSNFSFGLRFYVEAE